MDLRDKRSETHLPEQFGRDVSLPLDPSVLSPVVVFESETAETPTESPEIKEVRYGWCIVFCVFCIHLIVDGMTYSYDALYADVRSRFNASDSLTATVLSVQIGVTYGCGRLASFLDRRLGARSVVALGAVLASVGTGLSGLTTAMWQMILSYGILTGLGFGFMYLPAIVSVTSWFERRRALAVGLAVSGSGVGTFAFNPLTAYLLEQHGFTTCLLIRAGITLVGLLFGLFLRPYARSGQHTSTSHEAVHVELMSRNIGILVKRCWMWVRTWANWKLLTSGAFVLYAISSFLGGFAAYVPSVFQSDRAMQESNVEKLDASWLVSIGGITNIIGRVLCGVISDKKVVDSTLLYGIFCMVGGIGTCVSVFCRNFAEYAIYAGLYGFTGGAIVAIQTIVLSDIVGPDRVSGAFGILLLVQGIAVFIGPPFAGYLVEISAGAYYLCFVVFGSILILCGLITCPLPLMEKCRMHSAKIWRRESQPAQSTSDALFSVSFRPETTSF